MAYGTEYGLVVVDIVQKICLLNIASPDLYGSQDPYARTPRSPKRTETGASRDEQARSPSIDQVCTIVRSFLCCFFCFRYFSPFNLFYLARNENENDFDSSSHRLSRHSFMNNPSKFNFLSYFPL